MQQARSFTAPFIKKIKLTKNTYSFFFRISHIPSFTFTPGQYMRIHLPSESSDSRGTSRFFTIASSPLDRTLMITTHVIESTFKKTLLSLVPGQHVTFFGPMGNFILPDKSQPLVMVSEGTGITPFYSMLTYATQKKYTTRIFLFALFDNPEDILFSTELQALQKRNANSTTILMISKKQPASLWNGEYGPISKTLLQKYMPQSLSTYTFLIVGSSRFVEDTQKSLRKLAIPNSHIITEDFIGY